MFFLVGFFFVNGSPSVGLTLLKEGLEFTLPCTYRSTFDFQLNYEWNEFVCAFLVWFSTFSCSDSIGRVAGDGSNPAVGEATAGAWDTHSIPE